MAIIPQKSDQILNRARYSLALITGATGGLGRALAALLAAKGIPLLLTARDFHSLKELSDQLGSKTKVDWIAVDLCKDLHLLLRVIEEKKPDLVINNAGFGLYGSVADLEGQEEMITVNCTAPVLIAQKAAETWIKSGRSGTLLNVGSAAGFFEIPYFAGYCATKTFLRTFSLSMAEEMAQHNIHVLVSCPGQINTSFRFRASSGRSQDKDPGFSLRPEKVAELLWKQIEEKRRYQIIDWRYRLMVYISRCLPRKWLQRKLAGSILLRIR